MRWIVRLVGGSLIGLAACSPESAVSPRDAISAAKTAQTGTVAGTVTSAVRGALAGVTVNVAPSGLSAVTSGTGAFSIANVPAGSVTVSLTVLPSGCTAPAAQTVRVQKGKTATVNFSVTCTPAVPTAVVDTVTLLSLGVSVAGTNGSGAIPGFTAQSGANSPYEGVLWTPVDGLTLSGIPAAPDPSCLSPLDVRFYGGINATGQVSGLIYGCAPLYAPFLWTKAGGFQFVPPSTNGVHVYGSPYAGYQVNSVGNHAVNDAGTVAGSCFVDTLQTLAGFVPCTWSLTANPTRLATPLPLINNVGIEGEAYAITNTGQVAGYVYPAPATGGVYHAARWTSPGSMQDLGVPPGCTNSQAYDLNDSGVVVGAASCNGANIVPFRWTPSGGMQVLPLPDGTIPDGTSSAGEALSVNAGGVIVGHLRTPSRSGAALWLPDGRAFFLDQLVGQSCAVPSTACQSVAVHITDQNVVVGSGLGADAQNSPGTAVLRWTVTIP